VIARSIFAGMKASSDSPSDGESEESNCRMAIRDGTEVTVKIGRDTPKD